ncbi:MAG: type II toxin-antitoxin system HigA family antitoxin [Spirulina sp.]
MTSGLKALSNYYLELIAAFPPRPITNEDEYQATQEQINKILDRPKLTEDDRAYLKILGLTIYDYEETHEQFPVLQGVDLIYALLEESNLRDRDLIPILEEEKIVREILDRDRPLTPEYITKLAEFFNISPDNF